MARPRTTPDHEVFAVILRLLGEAGDKAVSFATVGAACGLAAPTLVQRYGSRDGMVKAALLANWDRLDAATASAFAASADKGAAGLLKALGAAVGEDAELALRTLDFRDPDLTLRAAGWRAKVESTLSLRLGGGAKAREAAALAFAAWQGQLMWQAAGERGFRLKDLIRRLG